MERIETGRGRGEEILEHWFGDTGDGWSYGNDRQALWFGKDPKVDAELRRLFVYDVDRAAARVLDDWASTARGRLALVILLDQLPRNIHRGTPACFAHDRQALELVLEGLDLGHDHELAPIERAFFYLPLQHSEDPNIQDRSVRLYRALVESAPNDDARRRFEGFLDYAVQHKNIIDRFGRFPHRNQLLGRKSSSEETEFLKQPGSSF